MRKFRDPHLNEVFNDLRLQGYDDDTAYDMVMELDSDLSSLNTMDYAEVLNIIDKMQEEDATNSD